MAGRLTISTRSPASQWNTLRNSRLTNSSTNELSNSSLKMVSASSVSVTANQPRSCNRYDAIHHQHPTWRVSPLELTSTSTMRSSPKKTFCISLPSRTSW